MLWWLRSQSGTARQGQELLRAAETKLHEKASKIWREEGVEAVTPLEEDAADIHFVTYNKSGTGRPVVCLHGYGTGSGIYATSLPVFAARAKALLPRHVPPIHALDTPGCGLSRRDAAWSNLSSAEAEALVVDSLEEWRRRKGYEDFVLVGHSIGAVLATAYAEKFPNRVAALALASPAGVAARSHQESETFSARRGLLGYVWSKGLANPFSAVRFFPERGKSAIQAYVQRRFRDDRPWTRLLKPELTDYVVANVLGPSMEVSLGGVLLTLLLEPLKPSEGLRPLEHRLVRPDFLRPDCRLAFLYGEHDWMPHAPALRVQAQRASHNLRTPVVFVDDRASHNLMVDNPIGFADALIHVLYGDDDYYSVVA